MVKAAIETSIERFRIPIEESVGAFIVPGSFFVLSIKQISRKEPRADPLGILKEGEVCYWFSQPRTDPDTQHPRFALEGDILVRDHSLVFKYKALISD